jgi:hypothetical protein
LCSFCFILLERVKTHGSIKGTNLFLQAVVVVMVHYFSH